jgi:hypothetical protein
MGFGIILGRIYAALLGLVELTFCRLQNLFGGSPQSGEITATIITCGESTYTRCLSAARSQTTPVVIKTVRDVHPLNASLDAALDSCETKWLLMVDADTILNPYCVELLSRHLKPGVGMVVAKLFDKVYGVIGFLRLVDAETLKEHRFTHPHDTPNPDRAARDFLVERGLRRVVLNATVGTHDPYGTPFESFRRFYGTYRKRDAEEQHMGTHLSFILKYACRNRAWNEVYYMIAGLVCAAIVDSERTRDYVSDSQMDQLFHAISEKDMYRDVTMHGDRERT